MKYFLLIAGEGYYPKMGTGDWIACFETEEEAKFKVKSAGIYESSCLIGDREYDWHRIVDLREWMENKQ